MAGLAFVRRESTVANQLSPATCGASGEISTQLIGCCYGLVCATSSINVNYGVCIPGDGGSITVGPSLISPFGEGVADHVAALAADNAATDTSTTTDTTNTSETTTTTEEERDARIAAAEARRTAQQNEQQLRKDQKKIDKQNRKEARRLAEERNRGPSLALRLTLPAVSGEPEIVKVTNTGKTGIVLNRIESALAPDDSADLLPPYPLAAGQSFLFLSGVTTGGGQSPNELNWNNNPVCSPDITGDGFLISAAFTADSVNHDYVVLCDPAPAVATTPVKSKKKKKSGRGRKPGNGKKNGKRQAG
ncbi:MAG: hypothetical protein H0T18_00890 [Chloroflexia bacterium]|nr:hypothetical protein [Chloroflexia bacterium]